MNPFASPARRARPAAAGGRSLGALLLVAFLFAAPQGSAQEGVPLVASIDVSGPTRTTRDAVLSVARVHEGDPWHDGLADDVLRELRNSRLFYDEEVDVEHTGDTVAVKIRVKDKWTLLPVPVLIAKSGESTVGVTVTETNLLGRAKALYGTVLLQDGRLGGSLLYVDPRLGDSNFQLFGYVSRRERTQQVWDENDKLGTYREQTTGASLGVGYRPAARTSVSASFLAQNFREREPEDGAVPPGNVQERAASVRFQYDGAVVKEETRRGVSGHVSVVWGLRGLGDELGRRAVSGEAKLAWNPVDRHTLSLVLRGLWTNERDYTPGSETGFLRGYEAGFFRPDRLFGGSLDYQLPFARFREVTLSGVGFADAALLRDRYRSLTPGDLQADAGLALAAYVRRVAVPVLQVYVAWGFSTARLLPGFSLGMAF